jgi:hypothetical protein
MLRNREGSDATPWWYIPLQLNLSVCYRKANKELLRRVWSLDDWLIDERYGGDRYCTVSCDPGVEINETDKGLVVYIYKYIVRI